tara:strand:- start:5350 stop:6597 length:1248 start_codon:yes stop_codon:yes gene_type:complete
MHFRWRTNPTVIAQYLKDDDIPRQAEVTLKPNEVCVVLEDGKIVGSVSQTHMEVNPNVGLFAKLFGRSNPVRAFLFAFTGPHPVMVQVQGVAENGDEINCLLTLKLEITRESAPRLITFPAQGKTSVQASDVAEVISHLTQTCALEILRKKDANVMRTVETSEDVIFELRNRLRTILDSHGFAFRGGYITWSSSAAEEQIKNQYVLQRIKMQHDFASDKERIELDAYIASEQRKAELNARLSLSNVHAEETAAMNLEIERLEAAGKFDLKMWEQEQSLSELKADAARASSIKDAELKNELAKLEVERQRIMAAPAMEIKEKRAVEDREAKAEQAKQAMAMFEEVQLRKQQRMAMNKEQEQMRLEQQNQGSEKTVSVLENIAANSTDPQVQLEALKQLAELRKTDLQAQKDAYKND